MIKTYELPAEIDVLDYTNKIFPIKELYSGLILSKSLK